MAASAYRRRELHRSTWRLRARAARAAASSPQQEEVRARALDANFDAERRMIGERVAVMFRWIFLAVLSALVNLTPLTKNEAKVTVDMVLIVWAAMAIVVTVILYQGY